MSSITTIGRVEYSDGPDRIRKGYRCELHHDGMRDGIDANCCCCDPCRYIRPPNHIVDKSCCRCVPRLLCMTFTPNVTANACCRHLSIAIPPVFYQGLHPVQIFNPMTGVYDTVMQAQPWDERVSYTGTINSITLSVEIGREVEGGPCHWFIDSPGSYISEKILIDHINVTCLAVPSVSIDNIVDSKGCVGTIAFGVSDMAKVPFHHDLDRPPLLFFVPTWQGGPPQCNCQSVPEYLCVDGVRHRGDAREQVRFRWNEALGDRWSYLPCNGNITTDQEHIYLRGDHYGNCYLELDFEQTGSNTNDWGGNTIGVDIHEIREGMLPIDSCGCDIFATDRRPDIPTIELPTIRFVNITAGYCGCWEYVCGNCRCVSKRVCITGYIDGQVVIADGIWDGVGWTVAADGARGAFRVNLVPGPCGACVLQAVGTFNTPFYLSEAVECGEAMSGEIFSRFDANFSQTFNWLWVTAAPCDCLVSPCFLCLEERCGGMPEIIYYDITTQAQFIIGYDPEEFCNITIELYYFKRFFGPSRQIICGYIGYAVVACAASASRAAFTRVIRVSVLSGGPGAFNYQIDMADLSAASPGPLVFTAMFGNTSRPTAQIISCDPFVADTGFYSMPVNCRWACADIPRSTQPTNMREMFTE